MPTLSTHPETVRPLTEAELLRMPDSEYMSPRQLTYFRKRLLELREELLRESDSLWPTVSDLGTLADLADRATLEEEQSRMRRLRNRERQLMARIEAALTRIEAGTYGFCEDTGERIELRRLLARPMARLTLEAQQNREHQKITYGA